MNPELLSQADRILTPCGRPVLRGAAAVPLYKGYLLPMVLQPGATTTWMLEVTGETTFALEAISSSVGAASSAVGVRIQIQLPNGKMLIGQNGQDIGQFGWVGSWRYVVEPSVWAEPGSKIQVTLADVAGLSQPYPVTLLFEGQELFFLKGESGLTVGDLASSLPRYQGIVNENILAPCWVAGYGPETPEGSSDDFFTYTSDLYTVPVAGPFAATAKVQIDSGLDFICRRLLFEVTADNTALTGLFRGRVRTGAGYLLTDSYVDLARYINGAPMPADWRIRGGDSVLVDLNLTDATGTGNFYFRVHLQGVKRRAR